MMKLWASIALLTMLAMGRGAGAAEAIGWITLLDYENDRIVLDDGQTFGVSEEINFSGLNDRVRVRIVYDQIDGQNIVTDVFPATETPAKATAGPTGGTSSLSKQLMSTQFVNVADG